MRSLGDLELRRCDLLNDIRLSIQYFRSPVHPYNKLKAGFV